MLQAGDLLWEPSEARVREAEVTKFIHWLAQNRNVVLKDYHALWRWSVNDIEAFWQAVWDYYEIKSSTPYSQVLHKHVMPGARWFEGARLNYAEHILRKARDDQPAMYFAAEGRDTIEVSWSSIGEQVARIAHALRERGIERGDRVVAFMPNIPETMIACLATASIGAIWSSTSTDFGAASVLDRFQQIEPKAIFTVDGYRYGGKDFDRRDEARAIIDALPTLEHVFFFAYNDKSAEAPVATAESWHELLGTGPSPALHFEQVPFDHPLWVVYSSGTTGLPKAIVHGHGGIILELHKNLNLHLNLSEGSRMFFYTTSGWIMWNILMSSFMVGRDSGGLRWAPRGAKC